MNAKNVRVPDLEQALTLVNEKYEGNITWKRAPEYYTGKVIRFTLTVKDSGKMGGRRSQAGRKISAACWHVHGDFFDALFSLVPEATIRSRGKLVTALLGNWVDVNIGSSMCPLYYSEACECE